jgi:molybdopterin converting factor small subunit
MAEAARVSVVVSISFNGLQRKVTSEDRIQIPVSEKTRVNDLLKYIQESYPDIRINKNAILVTINNEVSNLDQILKDNDHICFIPHIGGG